MPIKTNGKIYKTAVRPATTYGVESSTTLKKLETKLYTIEIEITKSTVRRSFKISPVASGSLEGIDFAGVSYSVKIALNILTKPRGKRRPPSS